MYFPIKSKNNNHNNNKNKNLLKYLHNKKKIYLISGNFSLSLTECLFLKLFPLLNSKDLLII